MVLFQLQSHILQYRRAIGLFSDMDDKAPLIDLQHPYSSGPPSYETNQWQGPVIAQPQVQYAPPMGHGYGPQPGTVLVAASVSDIPKAWSSKVCDCTNKPVTCLFAYCCPCCFTAMLAKRFGSSWAYGFFCGRHLEMVSRPYLRGRHNIQGDFYDDCCITTCYGPCSLCQVDRELDRFGYPDGKCC